MPHQCVRCGKIYDDGSQEILTGCSCGGRLFFYIKKEKLTQLKKSISKLSPTEKQEIERDVLELIGAPEEQGEEPIVLDFESIRVLKPGKYELDLVQIFKKKPLIYKVGDGKYYIDLAASFELSKSKSKKEKR
ncbi:MAG: Zn-ribbon domain-containing protein [Candidatus Woesearchaeota archaeon]